VGPGHASVATSGAGLSVRISCGKWQELEGGVPYLTTTKSGDELHKAPCGAISYRAWGLCNIGASITRTVTHSGTDVGTLGKTGVRFLPGQSEGPLRVIS
jgi:hypothetical protein